MISAPRFATRGMKWSTSHSRAASWPPSRAARSAGHRLAAGRGVRHVGELGRRVIAPDRDVADVADRRADRGRQLRERPVVVETGERGEPIGRHVGRVRRGDERIRVGRVADHDDAHVVGGMGVDGLALRAEDAAVRREQVAALHARGTRPRTDEERRGSRRGTPLPDRRTRRRASSSGNAESCSSRAAPSAARTPLRDLEQVQPHRDVGAEHLARGDAEQQRVADLPPGARDGDRDRLDAHAASLRRATGGGIRPVARSNSGTRWMPVTSRASPRSP